jgi:hypothetical protein
VHELALTTRPVPKVGPWKLKDEFGVAAAVTMVKHSLDPGLTESTVQYENVINMKSDFANMYHASVENQSAAIIGGKDGKKQLVLGAPIYAPHDGGQGGARLWPVPRSRGGVAHLVGKVMGVIGFGRGAENGGVTVGLFCVSWVCASLKRRGNIKY